MALTREMAQKVIDVVCKDPHCVHQIKAGNVNLAGLPRSNNVGMAVVRNVVNASGVAFGMLPDGDNSMLGSIRKRDGRQSRQDQCCNEIFHLFKKAEQNT